VGATLIPTNWPEKNRKKALLFEVNDTRSPPGSMSTLKAVLSCTSFIESPPLPESIPLDSWSPEASEVGGLGQAFFL